MPANQAATATERVASNPSRSLPASMGLAELTAPSWVLASPAPTRLQELERKHASDRELWRRDTAEAVRQAREEMAAATDQRLDATTKQTILENEAMAGAFLCGLG